MLHRINTPLTVPPKAIIRVAMAEPVCDPATGVCELPPAEKKEKVKEHGRVSDFELLKLANVSTLVDDKGNEVKLDSLSPTPLVLLYFSAVPFLFIETNVVMVSSLSFIHA
jgi:hypothetical protein